MLAEFKPGLYDMPADPSSTRRRNRGFLGSDSSALPAQDVQVRRPFTALDHARDSLLTSD